MTEQENLKNIMECPRFQRCDIPRCPLDVESDLRTELAEDEKCPNWRFSKGRKPRGVKVEIITRLKGLCLVIEGYRRNNARNSPS